MCQQMSAYGFTRETGRTMKTLLMSVIIMQHSEERECRIHGRYGSARCDHSVYSLWQTMFMCTRLAEAQQVAGSFAGRTSIAQESLAEACRSFIVDEGDVETTTQEEISETTRVRRILFHCTYAKEPVTFT